MKRAGFELRVLPRKGGEYGVALYERTGYVETARTTEHGFTRVFYEKRL